VLTLINLIVFDNDQSRGGKCSHSVLPRHFRQRIQIATNLIFVSLTELLYQLLQAKYLSNIKPMDFKKNFFFRCLNFPFVLTSGKLIYLLNGDNSFHSQLALIHH